MRSDEPLVTVAIATRDGEDRIAAAIQRVLDQGDEGLDVVVVENGSVDATAQVASSIDDPRLRVLSFGSALEGLSRARNAGIAAARGRWVVFLDDDDIPHDDWLPALTDALATEPALVVCGWQEVDPAGAVLRSRLPSPDGNVGVQLAGTFAIRRDVLDAVGGYADDLPISHQTELMWRVLPHIEQTGEEVVTVPRALIDIVKRPPSARWSTEPDRVLAGVAYLLEHHRERLAGSPRSLADLLNVQGVAYARVGDLRRARRSFRQAIALHPRGLRSWGRWLLAGVPPLARRQWPLA